MGKIGHDPENIHGGGKEWVCMCLDFALWTRIWNIWRQERKESHEKTEIKTEIKTLEIDTRNRHLK